MGIILPQLAPASEDRVSGAQVITSSLKFNGHQSGGVHGYGHLRRTSSGASGAGTFTISWWAKRGSMRDDWQYMIAGDNGSLWGVGFPGSSGQRDSLTLFNGSHQYSSARFRDNSGWYHIVLNVNSSTGAQLWVNNELQSNTNSNASWNLNNTMYIGKWNDSGTPHNYDGYLAQYTCIDGLELGPAYFAETDPLTGAWRPKRFYAEGTTVNDGTNWSSSISNAGNNPANLFDGGTSQYVEGNVNGTPVTWTGNVSGITKLEFYGVQAGTSRTFAVNGVDKLSLVPTGSAGWFTVPDVTTLTAFSFSRGGSGNYVDLFAVRVDGVIMHDNTTQNLAFGNAGFYLPLDGNTPIGQDLSGNGNDWKPQGFGGSVELDSTLVTGARPILNTTQGGAIAAPGVFGSKENKTVTVTVASKTGGGNAYFFDSVERDSLATIRGATITFDTTDSSNNTHPFKLSSTNADSSGGTEYTDGVAYYINGSKVSGSDYVSNYSSGAASGFRGIKWTVPHNVSTTYYYCTVHNGMGEGGRLTSTTDETKADPYAWKCVLAMPLVGSNTDVCDQINCTTTAKVLAPQGNAAASSGQSNWYSGSYYFDGSGDYLGATSHADFAMGTGDFTLECWVYRSGVGGFANFLATRGGPGTTAGYTWGAQSSGNGYDVEFYTNNMTGINGGNQWVTGGQWHHVAITRTGTTLSSYVNGILNTTTTNSQNFTNTSLAVGMTNDGGQGPFHGYIQDIRIYKGVAKYTGGTIDNQVFIIPATEPNFIPDCPAGVATKSKLKKITEGAVSFDGDGDYLSIGTSSDFDMDGDFTAEAWVYPTSHANDYAGIFGFSHDSDQAGWNVLVRSGSGRLHINVDMTYTDVTGSLSLNKWTHLALVRSGTGSGNCKLYIDGVADPTTLSVNNTTGTPSTTGCYIGSYPGYETAREFTGFISNARVIKGTALYTSNFTPPTEPLTAVTNTKLLCCQSTTSETTAAVTPNPITPRTEGYRFTTAKIYSTYGGGARAANYTVQWSDDNSSWTDAWSGNMSNNSSCGLQLGTGYADPGPHRYWRYVEGGATNGHHPRVSRIVLSDGTTDVNIKVYVADNCSDNGDYQIGTTSSYEDTTWTAGTSSEATATNFNPFNTDINTVRGQEGIYATLNAKDYRSFTNGPTYNIFNGGLTTYMVAGSANASKDRGLVASTMDLPSGKKWYCEINVENISNTDVALGIASQLVKGYYELGGNPKPGAYLLRAAGQFHYPTGQLGTDSNRSWTSGDLIGLAVDLESTAKTITFYKNGIVLHSHAVDESEGPFKFAAGTDAGGSNTYKLNFNFGQKPFKFLPSGGFQPLSASTVRQDTVIPQPDQYVKANIYTGSGSSRSIDVGFRPDMIWLKDRTQATHNNNIIDSLNGAPNIIIPDSAGTTLITNSTDGLTAITDTGFDLGANTAGTQSYELNKNGNNYVAWTWRAGGAPTASNSATSGAMAANSVSIDGVLQSAYTPSGSPNKYPSKMSIGTKQGFSVVQWEDGPSSNKNIPHGLSEIPTFYIIKNVDAGDNYVTYTTNKDGSLDYVFNFGTDGFSDSSRNFPTTSTVNFETASGGTHIMYCWHDVPGLHKSGTYRGFNSSNGPVIDLGFRPAIILLKKLTNTDSNSGWHWYDNKRNTHNPTNNFLLAGHAYYENRAANNTADISSYTVDFTSNGFRMSHGSNNLNNTNETYFYAAWAEAPAFNLYGGQATAR